MMPALLEKGGKPSLSALFAAPLEAPWGSPKPALDLVAGKG
jgi:hypothetical protein